MPRQHDAISLGISIAMGVPQKWMVYKGKSESKVDDNSGDPHLLNPPVCIRSGDAEAMRPFLLSSTKVIRRQPLFYLGG